MNNGKKARTQQDIRAALDDDSLLTFQTVMTMSGLARSTIRQRVRKQTFPKPIVLGPNHVMWRARDVRAWLKSRGGPEGPPDHPDDPFL